MNKNSQVTGKIYREKIVQQKFDTIYTLFSEQSSGLRKKNFFFYKILSLFKNSFGPHNKFFHIIIVIKNESKLIYDNVQKF